MKKFLLLLLLGAGAALYASGVLRTGAGGAVKSLDPALADDLAGRDLVALCYDTLVQYDYLARPYRLKPSMLAAAVLPEMAALPKEFIEDWIITLEIEKTQPCRPAGMPIFTICQSSDLWKRSFLSSSL